MKLETIARKVGGLSHGDQFTVRSIGERVMVLNVAKTLKRAGAMRCDVTTRKNKRGGYTVVAY